MDRHRGNTLTRDGEKKREGFTGDISTSWWVRIPFPPQKSDSSVQLCGPRSSPMSSTPQPQRLLLPRNGPHSFTSPSLSCFNLLNPHTSGLTHGSATHLRRHPCGPQLANLHVGGQPQAGAGGLFEAAGSLGS